MRKAIADLLVAARAAGTFDAEVFVKSGRGRKIILEPGPDPGRPPALTITTGDEEGVALRLRDRDGRWGFAWLGGPIASATAPRLLESALASAGQSGGAALASSIGLDLPLAGRAETFGPRDLRIADPESLGLPADRLGTLLQEAAAALSAATSAVAVDRLILSEAMTTMTLVNSRGFDGRFERSLAHLTVGLVPLEPGAAAVIEERSACRLGDLDLRDSLNEAMTRALPPRPAGAIPDAVPAALVLTPRAAATFLAGLAPWAIAGDLPATKGSALQIADDPTLPGRPGTSPFDGAGRAPRRTILVQDGNAATPLSAEGGHAQRSSYRDPPALGPSLLIIPAARSPRAGPERQEELLLRAVAVDLLPGRTWRLRIRRGDWMMAGQLAGPADGLEWEGSLAALIQALVVAGEDLAFYHCGAPLGAPSLRFEGLGPFRVEAAAWSRPRI